MEAKYAIHGLTKAIDYPPALKKEFGFKSPLIVVTAGGQKLKLSSHCIIMPITELHDYLLQSD